MSLAQRRQATVELGDEFVGGCCMSQTLMRDRLHHCQRILDAMRQLAEQHRLARFQSLALGDIDERNDDTVDLVVKGAVGTQAKVKPAVAAAANLAPDRREMRQ